MTALTLVAPAPAYLAGYVDALRQGWSPSNVRDLSAEQIATIARDPAEFLASFTRSGGSITLGDGKVVPRLPGPVRWMWDGDFCGAISLRYVPGTEDLPSHVLGHIGYAVVPWKRRLGYATASLRQILPLAVDAGLRYVDLTCDAENRPSQKVIEANGGTLVARTPDGVGPGQDRLLYRILLSR
jgi:predicted acetyltransferase